MSTGFTFTPERLNPRSRAAFDGACAALQRAGGGWLTRDQLMAAVRWDRGNVTQAKWLTRMLKQASEAGWPIVHEPGGSDGQWGYRPTRFRWSTAVDSRWRGA